MKHTILRKKTFYALLSIFGVFSVTLSAYAAPTITFTNDVAVGPTTSDTITITTSGTAGATERRYAFSTDTNCANDTYSAANSFTSGSAFNITSEVNNGKYICARVVDNSGTNYQRSVNTLNIDTTTPTLTITNDVSASTVLSDTLQATASDTNLTTLNYGFSTDSTCNASDSYPNTFTSGVDFSITDESHNGEWVCFRATDGAGNIRYRASANALDIDVTAPTMFFLNNVAQGPVTSDTIQVSTLDLGSGVDTRNYGFSADSTCNSSDTYPNNFTGTSFTISTETNNGKYMCFRAVDNLGNTSYLASAFPLNIDTTPNGVSFSDNVAVGPVASDTITIVATGENPGTVYEYSFSNTNSVCNGGDFNGTVYTFVDGTPFTISDESHNVRESLMEQTKHM